MICLTESMMTHDIIILNHDDDNLLDREFRKKTSPSLLNLKSPMQSPRNSKVTIIIISILVAMQQASPLSLLVDNQVLEKSYLIIFSCSSRSIQILIFQSNTFPAVLSTLRIALWPSIRCLLLQRIPRLPQVVKHCKNAIAEKR